MKQDIIEMLDEIQSICIGADSPDAIENGKNNPADDMETYGIQVIHYENPYKK